MSEELISRFYTAFSKADWQTMASCYHPQAEFTDEAFVGLKGAEVMAMWRMLIERSRGNLNIKYSNVKSSGEKASADWLAEYKFSATGRRVINQIHAEFVLKDGKIFRHRDSFNLHRWAAQAMGFRGRLLGGFGFFRKKVQQTARQSLDKYIKKQAL
jgi:ketosteroid isomerase-like protein